MSLWIIIPFVGFVGFAGGIVLMIVADAVSIRLPW